MRRLASTGMLLALGLLAAEGAAAQGAGAAGAADAGAKLERGKAVFVHRCGMCHREGGTGTIILGRRLGKEKSLLEGRTDLQPDYVRHVVRWGFINMPRISRVELPDADLDALIDYLRSPQPR